MFDQMNYQIYPYHINKTTNYEKANYSPLILNFKNIQIRWRITIPLYSRLPPNIALINIMPSNNFLFNKYYETRCLDYIFYTHKFTMLNQSQAN